MGGISKFAPSETFEGYIHGLYGGGKAGKVIIPWEIQGYTPMIQLASSVCCIVL